MKTLLLPIIAVCLLINTEQAISQDVKSLKKIAIVNFHASTTTEFPLSKGDIPRTERKEKRFLCSQKILNHSYQTMVNELNTKGITVMEFDKTETISKNILGVKSQEESNKQNVSSASSQAEEMKKNNAQSNQAEIDKQMAEKMKNLTPEQQALLKQYGGQSMSGANQTADQIQKQQAEQGSKLATDKGKSQDDSREAALNGDAPCEDEVSSPSSPCNYLFAKQTYYAGQIYGRLPCNKKADKSDNKLKDEKFKQYLNELKKEGAEAYMIVEIYNYSNVKAGIGNGELYSGTSMSVSLYDLNGTLIYTNTRKEARSPKVDGVAGPCTTLYGVYNETSEGVKVPVKSTSYNDYQTSVEKKITYEYTSEQELEQCKQSSDKAVKTTVVQLLSGK